MHTTRYNHSGHEITIWHNSDWSGEAKLSIRRPNGERIGVEAPGSVLLGLSLLIANGPIQAATEDAIEKLIADTTFGE